MRKYFEILKSNYLFGGISFSKFEKLLNCLFVKSESYEKDDIVLRYGDNVSSVGIVITGSVSIIKENQDNTEVIKELYASGIFGEVFACAGVSRSPISVKALSNCEILFIDYKKIVNTCSNSCEYHKRLVENLLFIISKNNLSLNKKIEILSKRTTRDKLLLFFEYHRGAANKFTIPYNREELASYLCVDRSAMCNELCKMRKEGIINFNKNEFEILVANQ